MPDVSGYDLTIAELKVLEQRLVYVEKEIEELKKEFAELKATHDECYKHVMSISVLEERLNNIIEQFDETKETSKQIIENQSMVAQKLDLLELQPDIRSGKMASSVKTAVLTAVCSSVAVSLATLLLRVLSGT